MSISRLHDYDVNTKNGEIYLFDDDNEEITHKTAVRFIKNLHACSRLNNDNGINNVTIHLISSHGGDISSGWAIYDSIQNYNGHVKIIGYGAIYSIASMILQAADQRILTQNCTLYLHKAVGNLEYSHNTLKIDAEQLEQENNKIIAVYMDKIRGSSYLRNKYGGGIQQMFINRITEGFYLSAEMAVEWGLADDIT